MTNTNTTKEKKMTKNELMSMLFCDGRQTYTFTSNGRRIFGVVHSIQREDGSGSSFNVSIWNHDTQRQEIIYVRTID